MDSALLVMDVQPGIIDRLDDKDAYLEKLNSAVQAARDRPLPVIFVVVGFRSGFPEVSPENKSFSSLTKSGAEYLVEPRPFIEPVDNEPVVYKRRVSAFSGSDLEVILRAQGVNHLILTGIATSGVVLSTLRQAADKDYRLTVLSDLCADSDEEVHKVLIEKVFPRQAEILTSDEWRRSGEAAR